MLQYNKAPNSPAVTAGASPTNVRGPAVDAATPIRAVSLATRRAGPFAPCRAAPAPSSTLPVPTGFAGDSPRTAGTIDSGRTDAPDEVLLEGSLPDWAQAPAGDERSVLAAGERRPTGLGPILDFAAERRRSFFTIGPRRWCLEAIRRDMLPPTPATHISSANHEA